MSRVVVFYTRMAPYFWDCMRYAVQKDATLQFEVVAHESVNDAPLDFVSEDRITIHSRNRFDLKALTSLVLDSTTDLLLVVGWTDREYLQVALRCSCTTVCLVDNPYRGDLRQTLGKLFWGNHLRKCFSYIWVPGVGQYEFARRIGFAPSRIMTDLYCANDEIFCPPNDDSITSSAERVVLFTGRLVEHKGVLDLIEAFQIASKRNQEAGWTLEIVGTGPLKDTVKIHCGGSIRHAGFVPPQELPSKMQHADIFCLPSWEEHWGVVVHEAALAGLPLVLSDSVGASSQFLIDGFNGFSFEKQNVQALAVALEKVMGRSSSSLRELGQNSLALGQTLTRKFWFGKLMSLLHV